MDSEKIQNKLSHIFGLYIKKIKEKNHGSNEFFSLPFLPLSVGTVFLQEIKPNCHLFWMRFFPWFDIHLCEMPAESEK